MTPSLPPGVAVVVLGPSGAALGRRVRDILPGARLYGPRSHAGAWDESYERVVPLLRQLFTARRPIVGICASGILIRAVAPLIEDKRVDPPVVALAEDCSVAVPLLGGHHGGNAMVRTIAEAFGGTAAITTAGDLRLGFALDEPPPGWRIANPERVKPIAAALLAGESVVLVETAARADWLRAGSVHWDDAGSLTLSSAGRARGQGEGAEQRAPMSRHGTTSTPPSPCPLPSIAGAEGEILWSAADPPRVVITERETAPNEEALVYHPPVLALGIGCERFCPAGEIIGLARASLAEAGLAEAAVGAIVSVELKVDEPGVHALAQALGVPARFIPAARLLEETPRLTVRSAAAFLATGCWGVAEGAALAAAGPDGELVVARRQSPHATCAIARAAAPLDPATFGRPRGRLAIIGIGPGDPSWRTPEASVLLAEADDIVGYHRYLDLLGPAIAGKSRHGSAIGAEMERARLALELAAAGRIVALVSSGDAGIYGLGALVYELLDREGRRDWAAVEIIVAPGVSAMQAAAARVGAPLGHDFCAISLSDLLTPWQLIRERLDLAARADLVIALYNPRSARRPNHLAEAASIIMAHRPAETPVVIGRNLGRAGESHRVVRLGELAKVDADMLSLVLVGNRQTRLIAGNPRRVYTPRGYFDAGSQ